MSGVLEKSLQLLYVVKLGKAKNCLGARQPFHVFVTSYDTQSRGATIEINVSSLKKTRQGLILAVLR